MSDRDSAEPHSLSPSEALDEDDLRVDPLEEGVEPPEHWSAANRYGTTPSEIREGEPIRQRLAEEEPDTEPEPVGSIVGSVTGTQIGVWNSAGSDCAAMPLKFRSMRGW